jgi:hypothetical protein
VAAVLARVLRQAKKDFAQLDASWPEDEYQKGQRESLQQPLGLELPPKVRRRRMAVAPGFSLHADTWVHGNDRQGLERLARYGARGPVTMPPPPAPPAPPSPSKYTKKKPRPTRRLDWVALHQHTFGVDGLRCPCGGRRRIRPRCPWLVDGQRQAGPPRSSVWHSSVQGTPRARSSALGLPVRGPENWQNAYGRSCERRTAS